MIPNISRLISDAHREQNYRPVAVAIIQNRAQEMLFVESAKSGHEWHLPQGGIELPESAETALYREIQEELGIQRELLSDPEFLGFEDLDAKATQPDRRGFRKGKRYFFFKLSYQGSSALTILPSELRSYHWVFPDGVHDFLAGLRWEKKCMIEQFIMRAKDAR